MKQKCSVCDKFAVWDYMPNDREDMTFCDDHVPRGCSCNNVDYFDESENAEQFRDVHGRLLPCCEFQYNEEGFD